MRKKRTYIIIIIILVIYFLVLYLIWGKDNVKKESYTTTIMVGDNTIWSFSGKKWLNITQKSSVDKLNWQKFNVYVDNENLGENYVWHDDKWYVFDNNKKAVPFTGKFLAYRANYDINVLDFEEANIDDLKYVNEVLKDNDLNESVKFTTSTKTTVDIDNDGIGEDFYLISNAFADDLFQMFYFLLCLWLKMILFIIYIMIFQKINKIIKNVNLILIIF